MDEKVKDKDAEAAKPDDKRDELTEGLEETFPASDPVSVTRTRDDDTKDDK